MHYYPAYLDLEGRLVLLVGGGRVAARKLETLLAAGAWVRLVTPEMAEATAAQLPHSRVEHHQRRFEPADLEGVWLAVSATADETVNRAVADEAGRRRIFVNVVDVPPLCSFIVPAVVRRGDLALAVSTGGASPAAAARLRQDMESHFGPEWGPYLAVLKAVRKKMTERGRPAAENRPVFYGLVDSDLFELVTRRDWAGVDALVAGLVGDGYSLAELGLDPALLLPDEEKP